MSAIIPPAVPLTDGMTRAELEARRALALECMDLLDTDLANIARQLDDAEGARLTYGELPDPRWRASATRAKRGKGRERQAWQTVLGDCNRRLRALDGRAYEDHFISTAKAMLPPETFAAILAATRAYAPPAK